MPKPFGFIADKTPFRVQLESAELTGYLVKKTDRYHRFTRPIPLKKGDVFSYAGGKLILNGKPVVQRAYPGKKRAYRIGWAAKKIRLAVFPEGKHWIAADTRSYNVSQGESSIEAIKSLILTLQAEDQMDREFRRKGKQVIRWHVERTPGAKKELLGMEEKARKNGLLLDGVEWK